MGRAPCCEKESVKRGPWTPEEDAKLLACIDQHGVGNWRNLPKKAGLKRCGKSCRLRWTNYLRPDLKHGQFNAEEEQLIIRLHAALGSRWSLIAAQLPGRTDNDVKNYWNTRLKKKLCEMGIDPVTHKPISQLLADLARVQAGTLFPDQILPDPLHHLPPISYPPITTTTTTTTSHLYQGRRTPTQIDLIQGGALGFFLSSTIPFPKINNTTTLNTTLNNTLPTTTTNTNANANANYIEDQHLLQLGSGPHAPTSPPMQTKTCKNRLPRDMDNRFLSHPSTTTSSCGSVHQLVAAPANSSSDGNYHDLLWESL